MNDPASRRDLEQAAKYFKQGDSAKALALCDQVLVRAPGDVEALHLRALALGRLMRVDEAIAAFERAAAAHPQRGVVLVNYGNFLRNAGRHAEARGVYERATRAAPQFANAWNALGLACASLDDRESARAAYRRALEIDPRNAQALNNLGVLEAGANRHDLAVGCFSRAIELAPAMISAHVNRAASLRTLGRVEESLRELQRAAPTLPASADLQAQIAASCRALGRFDEAETQYKMALKADPARADLHRDLINMLYECGAAERAFATIDEAIAATGSAALMAVKSETALMTGEARLARAAAEAATSREPGVAAGHGALARAAQALGDKGVALAAARRSVALDPDDFGLVHHCAEIELAAGEIAAALKLLEREPPQKHLQKHIALKAVAMRLAGDHSYRELYDYDRLTAQIAIDPPAGHDSVEAFNAALAAAIAPLHRTKNRPVDQTLYGGTQSMGRFWNEPHPVIQTYVQAMRAAAARFVRALPDDSAHPFLARKTVDLDCVGAWSVMLQSGGGHVDHIHPAGWVSACYYVSAPASVLVGKRAGYLRLGGSGVSGVNLDAERWFAPTPGTVVFFPSYMWHGVEPFEAHELRITAPFDLAPLR